MSRRLGSGELLSQGVEECITMKEISATTIAKLED